MQHKKKKRKSSRLLQECNFQRLAVKFICTACNHCYSFKRLHNTHIVKTVIGNDTRQPQTVHRRQENTLTKNLISVKKVEETLPWGSLENDLPTAMVQYTIGVKSVLTEIKCR